MLSTLGAKTEIDSVVAGIHGGRSNGKLGIKATVAYYGGKTDIQCNLLGASVLQRWPSSSSVDHN